MSSEEELISVDYEVFGQVQGVFFRAYTEQTARSRNCVGWVKNTYNHTVKGVVQGKKADVEFMKNWLQTTGSPMSRIRCAEFRNERKLSALEYKQFAVSH